MTSRSRFLHFGSREEMTRAVAREISRILDESIAQRQTVHLALSGGSTPGPIYEQLARHRTAWSAVHLYWGDERCVPPTDPHSNYASAKRSLLDRIDIPPHNVHRIAGELTPPQAARQYEALLDKNLPQDAASRPVFDCVLLGVGTDGHTASLFPGDGALDESHAWTAVTDGKTASPAVPRVTLTLPVINAARHVLFAVAGAAKLKLVHEIEASTTPLPYPAARIEPASGAVWYVATPRLIGPLPAR